MKTSETAFKFPVLGITTDADVWGFWDLEDLTTCGPKTLKDDMQAGMELVDATGRHWRVSSVQRLGPAGSILKRALFFLPQMSTIDHELEALEPLSLDEIKARVSAGVSAHPDHWVNDVTESDDAREFAATLKSVASAKRLKTILDRLGLDTFEGY